MKTVKFIIFFMLFATSSAFAGQSDLVKEWSILFPSFQYFAWEEFDSTGPRILKEEGLLVGAGGTARLDLYDNKLMMKLKGEIFGGDVHYNGQTQDGEPVKTDVIYFGTKVEDDLGWRFPINSGYFEPFAGLGYRWWLRALQNSFTNNANHFPVDGSNEYWYSIYTRLGARAAWSFTKDLTIFAEGGGKYAFYNENRADLPDGGKVTIKPGSEWSAFGEIGLTYKRFRPTLYYEGFRFSRSHVVPIGNNLGVLQPKSESDIIGINLNWVF
jgi:hypothetical protein